MKANDLCCRVSYRRLQVPSSLSSCGNLKRGFGQKGHGQSTKMAHRKKENCRQGDHA